MIDMGQEFKNLMQITNGQVISARLNILNSPQMADYGFLTNSIEQYLIDNGYATLKSDSEYWIRQMNNCITNETAQYGIFESDGISLDGSIKLLSKTASQNEMGWYSSSLSNGIGVYSTYPYLQWNYGVGAISNFNIVFSKMRNEYAVDFDIVFENYTSDFENMVDPVTYLITGNTETIYKLANVPVSMDMGSSIKIIVKKWSVANARAKIIDLFFGEMLIYTDEEIVSINGSKAVDLTNNDITSKQIDFTVQDMNGDYNIFNPQGGLANLNKASRVALELGPVTDNGDVLFCKIDEYILGKPRKNKNSLEVSLTGYGRLNSYNNISFGNGHYDKFDADLILESFFTYDLNSHMAVSEQIKNEALTFRTQYGDISVSEALRQIATVVRGNVVETIDNDILITRIIEKTPVSIITLDNMWDTPDITKIDKPKSINIKTYYSTVKSTNTELFRQYYDKLIPGNMMMNYNVDHTKGDYHIYFWVGTMAETEAYAVMFFDNYALFTISGPWNDEIEMNFRITGSVVEISSSDNNFILDINATDAENIDNKSIETSVIAQQVFDWLSINYNKEFEYKVEIQDTCTYELGDTVTIESNIYVNGVQVVRNAIITGIDFGYEGSLHYILTLRGA